MRVLDDHTRVAIFCDEQLHALIEPAIEATAEHTMLCMLGVANRATIIALGGSYRYSCREFT